MKLSELRLTNSEETLAIKFGDVDNTDFANEFFGEVKSKLNIEIVLCKNYYSQNKSCYLLNCYIKTDCRTKAEDILTPPVKNAVIDIFYEMLFKYGVEIPESLDVQIIVNDFGYDVRWYHIERLCSSMEKFMASHFMSDVIVLSEHCEPSSPQHVIAFRSKADMEKYLVENHCVILKQNFETYISKKDVFGVFESYEYRPRICLTSSLTRDEKFARCRNVRH